MALCSCQGGKRACKFHPRESLSLHPPHQERIDTIPQTYAKISRNLTKGWGGGWNYARKATQPGRKFQRGSCLCQPWPQRKILHPLKAAKMARKAGPSLAIQTSLDIWMRPREAKANFLCTLDIRLYAQRLVLCVRQWLAVCKEPGKSSQRFSDRLSRCLRFNHYCFFPL